MSNDPVRASEALAQWHKAAAKSAPGGNVEALNWVTPEGIVVKPVYTAADRQTPTQARGGCPAQRR